ncbi:MAG: CopG family transcriptional regulator [Candidatus Dojkabacteria bacterium]|nr:CopG family transcriptional regulator [Candidatus Dojkabacteria bacterium]
MKKLTIEIADNEFSTLEKRVKDKKEFDSVEAYMQDIISQVVARLKDEDGGDEEKFSKEDEEKVKERLRSLGYLD